MAFTDKIRIYFNAKDFEEDIQYYKAYRKKGSVPPNFSSPSLYQYFLMQISPPITTAITSLDVISVTDSELAPDALPAGTSVLYDPAGNFTSWPVKIAIDDTPPHVANKTINITPNFLNVASNIGNLIIVWNSGTKDSYGTTWAYDVTAVNSGGLESGPAMADPGDPTPKIDTINVGLADSSMGWEVPTEYPNEGDPDYPTYRITISDDIAVTSRTVDIDDTASGPKNYEDNNVGDGWDTDGPDPVGSQIADGSISTATVFEIALSWIENVKSTGTLLQDTRFNIDCFSRAGYSSLYDEVSANASNIEVLCPITDGVAGVLLTFIDATIWQDETTDKNSPEPTPTITYTVEDQGGFLGFELDHGSIIAGTVSLYDDTLTTIYTEDTGTFLAPNNDGDYVIEYTKKNGNGINKAMVKIVNTTLIPDLTDVKISYKFGLPWTGYATVVTPETDRDQALLTPAVIVNNFKGDKWLNGSNSTLHESLDIASAYNYAWVVYDNAGRASTAVFAQGIVGDITRPTAVLGLIVEAIDTT